VTASVALQREHAGDPSVCVLGSYELVVSTVPLHGDLDVILGADVMLGGKLNVDYGSRKWMFVAP